MLQPRFRMLQPGFRVLLTSTVTSCLREKFFRIFWGTFSIQLCWRAHCLTGLFDCWACFTRFYVHYYSTLTHSSAIPRRVHSCSPLEAAIWIRSDTNSDTTLVVVDFVILWYIMFCTLRTSAHYSVSSVQKYVLVLLWDSMWRNHNMSSPGGGFTYENIPCLCAKFEKCCLLLLQLNGYFHPTR